MDTCQQCGAGINVVKPACGTCGTPVTPVQKKPVDLAPAWRARFAIIDKAGGPSLSRLKSLSVGERFKLLNWWALFLGAFYYVAKGMWRKAIVLTTALFFGVLLLELILDALALPTAGNGIATGATAAVYGLRANIDYYKKVMLGQNGWW